MRFSLEKNSLAVFLPKPFETEAMPLEIVEFIFLNSVRV
jgi:hypothetical protein